MGIHEEQLKVKGREVSREILVKELKEKLRAAYKADAMRTHEKVLSFTSAIKEQYPDYSKYQLWHLVIGSTIDDADKITKITHFDFPGDLSVEQFIKSL